MNMNTWKVAWPALAVLATALLIPAAQGQTNVRVRGTITAVASDSLSVKSRDGRDLKLELPSDVAVAVAKAARFEDIKPGDYEKKDAEEDPRTAVMRELWEETGAVSADYLDETDWMTYEFPPYDGPASHRLAKFRGQRQKWFALRFTGRDDEIDPLTPRNGQPAEFDQWRWERLDRVADLVVPFRRDVYRMVAREFGEFAR